MHDDIIYTYLPHTMHIYTTYRHTVYVLYAYPGDYVAYIIYKLILNIIITTSVIIPTHHEVSENAVL